MGVGSDSASFSEDSITSAAVSSASVVLSFGLSTFFDDPLHPDMAFKMKIDITIKIERGDAKMVFLLREFIVIDYVIFQFCLKRSLK